MNVMNESGAVKELNELFVNVATGLDPNVENSIYYAKLKQQLHPEIYNFCKEQLELKADLNFLRMCVGDVMTEAEIREYLDSLKLKYNNGATENVGLEYSIEITRVDYGVPVFVVIKRDQIYVKKFTFRFRKANFASGISDLTNSGVIIKNTLKGGDQ